MTFTPRLPIPGTGMQIVTEFSGMNRPQASEDDTLHLYKVCATLHAAANYRAENISMVKMKLVDEHGAAITDHPLAKCLQLNIGDTLKRTELSLIMTGSNLLHKARNEFNGIPMKLRWLNPKLWDLDKGADGLRGFRVTPNNTVNARVTYVPLTDAVYMHGVDFADDFSGVAPATVVYIYAGIDVELGTTIFSFFQNMAIPALMIQPSADNKTAPSKEDLDGLVGFFKRTFRGALNAGRTLVTPARWDIQRIQMGINELSTGELTQRAREAIFIGLQVPMELVVPGASSYAAAYEARRGWLEFWFVPRVHWYAQQLTEQLVHPVNPAWKVEADFEGVPGMKDVQARRTDTIGQQLSLGVISLQDAQKALDIEPNPYFKDIYMIGGVPTKPMDLQHRPEGGFQPTNKLDVSAPHPGNVQPFTPKPLIPFGRPGSDGGAVQPGARPPQPPSPAKSADWLPDDVFNELKAWRVCIERKGIDYPFVANHLHPDTLSLGYRMYAETGDMNQAIEGMKAHAYIVRGGKQA